MFQNIDNADFKSKMTQPNTVVMDVRTEKELQEGVIPQASVFIDINSEPFEERIKNLNKSGNYLIYCRSGARSAKACRIMEANGFTGKLYNLAMGISKWDGPISPKK